MRRPAKLENDPFLAEFFAGLYAGDAVFPEFKQSSKKSPGIGCRILVEEIDVAGEARNGASGTSDIDGTAARWRRAKRELSESYPW